MLSSRGTVEIVYIVLFLQLHANLQCSQLNFQLRKKEIGINATENVPHLYTKGYRILVNGGVYRI